ncbi:MAG TPA: hypothetical protein VIH17_04790 [Candidatus Acidoferrales bacterium]
MAIEGTWCAESEGPAMAGTGERTNGVAGECEWSTELDYRSYAAEELRELITGKEDEE